MGRGSPFYQAASAVPVDPYSGHHLYVSVCGRHVFILAIFRYGLVMGEQAAEYRDLASKRKKPVAQFFVCDDRCDAAAGVRFILLLFFQIPYFNNWFSCICLPQRKNRGHNRRQRAFIQLA